MKIFKKVLSVILVSLMLVTSAPLSEQTGKSFFSSVAEAAVAVSNGNKVGMISTYTTEVTYDSATGTYGNKVTDIVFNSVEYPVSDDFSMPVSEVEALVRKYVVAHIYEGKISTVELLENYETKLSVDTVPLTLEYSYNDSWWNKKKTSITGTVKNKMKNSSWSDADKKDLEDYLKLLGLSSYENVSVELQSTDTSKLYFGGISKAAFTTVDVKDIIASGDEVQFSTDIYVNTAYCPENGSEDVAVKYILYCGTDIEATGEITVNIVNTDYVPEPEFEEIRLDELLVILREKLDEYRPDGLKSKFPLETLFTAAIDGKKLTELKGIYDGFDTLKVAIDVNNMVCKADIGGLAIKASDAYLTKLFESIEDEAKSVAGYLESAVEDLISSDDFKDYLAWYQTEYGYTNGYYQKAEVRCPTNVTVTDDDGNIALTIIDNVVTVYDDLIYAFTYEGEKLFYLPANIDYNIEITATDNGTMDYIVSGITPGGIERVITYDDVTLVNGEGYTGLIPCEKFQPTDIYNLLSDKGETVEADSDTLPPVASNVTDVVIAEELFQNFSKEVIDLVADKMFTMQASVDLTNYEISLDDTVALFSAVSKYYPIEYSLMANGDFSYRIVYNTNLNRIIEIRFDYGKNADPDKYQQRVTAVKKEIETLVKQIEGMDDFEKALYIHDYMVLNCEYDTELLGILETEGTISGELRSERYTEYAVLLNGTGICGSYALAYRAILNAAGMECLYLSSAEMNHAWNMVKIDGEWYHVDCCWDDPVPDSAGTARRTYFLRTDKEMMALNHYSWTPGQYKATSEKYTDMPRIPDNKQKYDYDSDLWYYYLNDTVYMVDEYGNNKETLVQGISADAIDSYQGNIYYSSEKLVYEYNFTEEKWTPVYVLGYYNSGSEPEKAYLVNIFIDGNGISYYKNTTEYMQTGETYDYVETVTYVEDELKRDLFESITGVTLDYTESEIELFGYKYLNATINSDCDTSDLKIKWSSSDESVATVSEWGCVEAYNVGQTVITASCLDYSASCTVTVTGDSFSGSCNTKIKWSYDTDKNILTLSGSGAMPTYSSSSSQPWSNFREHIKEVVIGSGITSVGKYAFYNCTNMEKVSIPSGVTMIDEYAFGMCSSLTDISIPSTVNTIDMYAFYYCRGLESVVIPNGVTVIWNRSFFGCSSLKSVTIPDSVVQIGQQAFSHCEKLESITLPSKLSIISQEAFAYCYSLKNMTIPASISYIYDDAFYACNSLEDITVNPANTVYLTDEHGALYDYKKTRLMHYPAAGKSTSYTIPSSVTAITSYAFYNAENLESVTIPNSVTEINTCAFSGCSALKTVAIPDSVTTLGNSSFQKCGNLEKVTLGKGLTSIGNYTFQYCSKLNDVTISSSVTTIGNSAFEKCSSLKNIVIPSSVKTISNNAFYGCENLIHIGYECTEEEYANISIGTYGNTPLSECPYIHYAFDAETDIIYMSGQTPTCTATGTTDGYYCADCKCYLSGEIIPATGHSYDISESFEGTCTESPYDIYSCSKCDDSYTVYGSTYDGHKYETTVVAPTCTQPGYTLESCSVCGESTASDFTSPIGHKLVILKPANYCEGHGTYEYFCKNCDYNECVTVDASELETKTVTVEATCTESGTKKELCALCEATMWAEILSPKGHTFSDEWTVDKEATATEPGLKSKHCTNCNARRDITEFEYIGCTHSNTTLINASQATCRAEGYTGDTYCNDCEKVIANGEIIGKLSHSYTSVVTPPTCSANGYTTHTCSSCGDNYTSDETDKTAHSMSKWTTVQTPTCASTGTEKRNCSGCNYSETRTISKKAHTESILAAVAPTCTLTGLTEGKYCSVCKTTIVEQETIPENGHKYDSNGVCTDCGFNNVKKCGCNCHKSGLMRIVWKILNFFFKIFKTNKTCACGIAHY